LIEDYMKAVTTDETLHYDDIIGFADADKVKGSLLERLFKDGSLDKFLKSAEERKLAAKKQEEEKQRISKASQGQQEQDRHPLQPPGPRGAARCKPPVGGAVRLGLQLLPRE
jgi:hypothetical protein